MEPFAVLKVLFSITKTLQDFTRFCFAGHRQQGFYVKDEILVTGRASRRLNQGLKFPVSAWIWRACGYKL